MFEILIIIIKNKIKCIAFVREQIIEKQKVPRNKF